VKGTHFSLEELRLLENVILLGAVLVHTSLDMRFLRKHLMQSLHAFS
jgi:hypothetical protein